jgi:hypothetical protein
MIRLNRALRAWGTSEFDGILKEEVGKLDADTLLLQQGLRNSSYAVADDLSVMINHVSEDESSIHVRAGIFYSGIIAGCSCADDPSPVDAVTEFCELQFDIDKVTAETTVTLVSE